MSIKKKVSIKLAVHNLLEDVAMEDTRKLPVIKRWAVEADRDIGSYYSYKKKICVLDVCDCRAELPCDAVAVLALVIGDRGCECGSLFQGLHSYFTSQAISNFQMGTFYVVDGVSQGFGCLPFGWEIQNNNIVFNQNMNEKKVTIQYLGMEEDEEGFPLVNENHLTAISAYIEWRLAKQTRWKAAHGGNVVSELAIKELQRQWAQRCRQARADDGELSETDRRDIVRMVNNAMSGIGIPPIAIYPDRWGWY